MYAERAIHPVVKFHVGGIKYFLSPLTFFNLSRKEKRMKNKIEAKRLEVETEDAIYDIEFGQIQIEITGRCNMHCQHCRAFNQLRRDMPVDQIVKIILFARQFSQDNKEVVLSGGEPLLHRNFSSVLENVRASGVKFVSLTTNGFLFSDKHLRLIERLSFDSFAISVSLDSIDPVLHDNFRRYKGAFVKANNALHLISESNIPGVIASIRCTIQPSQIDKMEEMVHYARKIGCKGIDFSAVHPAGIAIQREDLWMSKEQKMTFLKHVYDLKEQFYDIKVSTTDPLKCLLCKSSDTSKDDELIFDGCGAAVTTFNVNADGTMTPCALLDIPMMNIFPLSIEEIVEQYQENPIVKNMLAMNFKGKCGICPIKYRCGGCRARALVQKGDYLEEDPHCWIDIASQNKQAVL